MSSIIENQDKLFLKWHPIDPILFKVVVWTKPPIPDNLTFYIHFKDTAPSELFYKIGEELKTFDGIEVITNPVREIINKKLKDEYIEADRVEREKDEARKIKIEEHISQLVELGCNTREVSYDIYKPSEGWLEEVDRTLDVTSSSYIVKCNSDTKFYKVLEQAGILETSYPKWYKEGRF